MSGALRAFALLAGEAFRDGLRRRLALAVTAILVLGHSDCGAIKGAIDNVKLGSLTELLAKIEPAVQVAEALGGGDPTSKNKAFASVSDSFYLGPLNELAVRKIADAAHGDK